MNDRHQIIGDQEFWTQLEHVLSHWLQSSEDKELGQFWSDGFLPDTITNTKDGVNVEGLAWFGVGGNDQYRFIVSVPQKMIHRRRKNFCIEWLSIDEAEKKLQLKIAEI